MNKTVLITGASSGFGKFTALELIKKGYTVYGAARRVEQMNDLAEAGGHALKMDVTNRESVEEGVQQIIKEQGSIDVLINNAGFATYNLIETTPIESVKNLFEVNVWGAVNVIQAVLPYMRKNRQGRIINTSSVVGKISSAVGGWYAASKHAVEAISDALRQEVHQFGIKVSIIEPGSFSTGFGGVVLKQFEQIKGGNDYKELVDNFIQSYSAGQEKAPTPEPVVEAMVDAMENENPQTRYLVGNDANALGKAKNSMSDIEFDQLVYKQYKLNY